MADSPPDLDALYRAHSEPLRRALTRRCGRADWAESAVQDAFLQAARTFHSRPPRDPLAWLRRVARNRVIDLARADRVRQLHAPREEDESSPPPEARLSGEWEDDRLRLIVAVCDPALTPDEQGALALHVLCDLPLSAVAAIYLAEEETVRKRLLRARTSLRAQGLRDGPPPARLEDRWEPVLRVIYGLFAEGHHPRGADDPVQVERCAEAIRLGELLARRAPDPPPELDALLALLQLSAARLPARAGPEVVLLEDQDRARWDQRLIDRGLLHLRRSARGGALSRYHLEATIAACHALAPDPTRTDWARILACYDALIELHPSPLLEINRAIALSNLQGPRVGLRALEMLGERTGARELIHYHAALAWTAERAGELERAAGALQEARAQSRGAADRRFFGERLEQIHAQIAGLRTGTTSRTETAQPSDSAGHSAASAAASSTVSTSTQM